MKLRISYFSATLLVILATSTALCMTIGEAKTLANGNSVTLADKVVTSSYEDLHAQIYIEESDRSAGIQVYISDMYLPEITEGNTVTVEGTLSTNRYGEKIVNNPVFSMVDTDTYNALKPVTMTNKAVGGSSFGYQLATEGGKGLSNIGMLVRAFGWVSYAEPSGGYVEIDDGSGKPASVNTYNLPTKPLVGEYIMATGVVSCKTNGSPLPKGQIQPRKQSDITSITPNVENLLALPVPEGKLAIIWIGQAGFVLIDHEGHKVAIDPYLSNYAGRSDSAWSRIQPVPIQPDKLQPGLVLLTHDHNDHSDPWTLSPINTSSQSVFWGPNSCYNLLGTSDFNVPSARRSTINRGQTKTWNGISITAVYANHTADSVGYMITMGGKKVYISGDTLYDQTLVNAVVPQHPDIMLVCINGKYGNMGYNEAASLVGATGPQSAIPMHYGMFAINTEDPQNFVNTCKTQGVTARAIVMKYGGYLLL